MQEVDRAASGENLLLSLATFSLIEGAVLYSSFAVLKSFRANGYNKMGAIANGINLSERDETLHSAGGAWLYLTTLKYGNLPKKDKIECEEMLPHVIKRLVKHEDHIIELIFEKGDFCGLTKLDVQLWVRERVNYCLKQLRMPSMYDVGKTKIGRWFDSETKGITHTDFFDGLPKYRKGFPLEGFDFSGLIEV
jgi:ribonucleotide reductase beta subunit family protein with ferritin-like domain